MHFPPYIIIHLWYARYSECRVKTNALAMFDDDLGVVRSICAEDKTIYILTPVEPSVLEKVNCIQCGAVSLPKCLRITSEVNHSM